MTPESITQVLSNPLAQELFASNIPAHISYRALDGTPRCVPISYVYDDGLFRVSSPAGAPKVAALQADPAIALSIDTTGIWPARTVLVRGAATVSFYAGVPEVYVRASARTIGEDVADFITSTLEPLQPQWAVVTITPTWAKLLDFETVMPDALAGLLAQLPRS